PNSTLFPYTTLFRSDLLVRLNAPPNTLVQPPNLLLPLIQKDTVTSTIGLIRRDAIIKADGFAESFRGLYEDQAFFAKVCTKSARSEEHTSELQSRFD